MKRFGWRTVNNIKETKSSKKVAASSSQQHCWAGEKEQHSKQIPMPSWRNVPNWTHSLDRVQEAGEIARLEKDLLYKHGNLRSGPQHTQEKPGIVMYMCSPSAGIWRQVAPQSLLTSKAKPSGWVPVQRKTSLKKKVCVAFEVYILKYILNIYYRIYSIYMCIQSTSYWSHLSVEP